MTGRQPPLLALLLPCLALAGYDGLAHYVSTIPDAAHWAVIVTLLPAGALAAGFAARRFGRLGGVLGALAVAAGVALVWPLLQANLAGHMSRLYLLQYLATNLALGGFFGLTLTGGRTPACTTFATVLQPHPSPTVLRYTRRLTLAWALFFVLSAALSALLYAFASPEAWSLFSNVAYLPSLALMFLVEGLVRRRVIPADERHGILDSIRAYMASTQPGAAPQAPTVPGNPIRQ